MALQDATTPRNNLGGGASRCLAARELVLARCAQQLHSQNGSGRRLRIPRTAGVVSGAWKGRAFNQHSLCWREEERVTTTPGKEAHSRIGLPLIGLKKKRHRRNRGSHLAACDRTAYLATVVFGGDREPATVRVGRRSRGDLAVERAMTACRNTTRDKSRRTIFMAILRVGRGRKPRM